MIRGMRRAVGPIPDVAAEILRRFRRIAVVGISDRPERPSHEVAAALLVVMDRCMLRDHAALVRAGAVG